MTPAADGPEADHLTRIIDALSGPSAYAHEAPDIVVHQTHISVVFLAGEFAYKIKKPLTLPFLDYGTLGRRRRLCHEEVRLNRRLAPDVYLGVVPIVSRQGGLEILPDPVPDGTGSSVPGGEGVFEWAVKMRRLPPERTLLSLIEAGLVDTSDMTRIAENLVGFHERAARGPRISRFGRYEVVARNARDNLSQSSQQVGPIVDPHVFERLSRAVEETLAAVREQIEERAGRGVPRDTHGDLRLDHVYLLEGRPVPLVIDCIEFNPAFRFADPVADMAFLAMDLEMAGRYDLSAAFSDAYFDRAGDQGGRNLLPFYVSYRAAIRGKVQGIKAAEAEIPAEDRQAAARIATGHWLLALGAIVPPRERPGLVLVAGLPGTGKTTLAQGLSERAGFVVVRSDVVRKELAGLDPESGAATSWEGGIYTPAWSARTYEACRLEAEEVLLRGGRVVVDASFHSEDQRRAFLDMGIRLGVRVRFLICEAEPSEAKGRLARRRGDASDADPGIYDRMVGQWEAPGNAVARALTGVPTDGGPDAALDRALATLRDAGLHD